MTTKTTLLQPALTISEFSDALAPAFYDINAQWIEAMFVLEAHDIEVLRNPRRTIINQGGAILYVSSERDGIIGVCALKQSDPGCYELTKMGVRETVRGLKTGEFLLQAILERARTMDMKLLYLLTSKKCLAAIHLYEKLGFEHSPEIMRTYGATYERSDVAMEYRGRLRA